MHCAWWGGVGDVLREIGTGDVEVHIPTFEDDQAMVLHLSVTADYLVCMRLDVYTV
jgi:hypothetical protein